MPRELNARAHVGKTDGTAHVSLATPELGIEIYYYPPLYREPAKPQINSRQKPDVAYLRIMVIGYNDPERINGYTWFEGDPSLLAVGKVSPTIAADYQTIIDAQKRRIEQLEAQLQESAST